MLTKVLSEDQIASVCFSRSLLRPEAAMKKLRQKCLGLHDNSDVRKSSQRTRVRSTSSPEVGVPGCRIQLSQGVKGTLEGKFLEIEKLQGSQTIPRGSQESGLFLAPPLSLQTLVSHRSLE